MHSHLDCFWSSALLACHCQDNCHSPTCFPVSKVDDSVFFLLFHRRSLLPLLLPVAAQAGTCSVPEDGLERHPSYLCLLNAETVGMRDQTAFSSLLIRTESFAIVRWICGKHCIRCMWSSCHLSFEVLKVSPPWWACCRFTLISQPQETNVSCVPKGTGRSHPIPCTLVCTYPYVFEKVTWVSLKYRHLGNT